MPQLIMVARPAVVSMCNAAATNADPDGRTPFTVPLKQAGDASNTVAAYWCCWTMTSPVGLAIRAWMTNHGATAGETKVYAAGQNPPAGNRIAIFDGAGWAPDQVLAQLGLAIIPDPQPVT